VRKEPVVGSGLTQAQFAMIIQTAFGPGVLLRVTGKVYLYKKTANIKKTKRKRKKK
jgi:hypothetical protein